MSLTPGNGNGEKSSLISHSLLGGVLTVFTTRLVILNCDSVYSLIELALLLVSTIVLCTCLLRKQAACKGHLGDGSDTFNYNGETKP